jgi:hypothetical protein
MPRFKKRDMKKSDNVMRPKPPSCMSERIITFPKLEKYVIGTVLMPVTHVQEADVKKRSISGICTSLDWGKASKIVPTAITKR